MKIIVCISIYFFTALNVFSQTKGDVIFQYNDESNKITVIKQIDEYQNPLKIKLTTAQLMELTTNGTITEETVETIPLRYFPYVESGDYSVVRTYRLEPINVGTDKKEITKSVEITEIESYFDLFQSIAFIYLPAIIFIWFGLTMARHHRKSWSMYLICLGMIITSVLIKTVPGLVNVSQASIITFIIALLWLVGPFISIFAFVMYVEDKTLWGIIMGFVNSVLIIAIYYCYTISSSDLLSSTWVGWEFILSFSIGSLLGLIAYWIRKRQLEKVPPDIRDIIIEVN